MADAMRMSLLMGSKMTDDGSVLCAQRYVNVCTDYCTVCVTAVLAFTEIYATFLRFRSVPTNVLSLGTRHAAWRLRLAFSPAAASPHA